MTNGKCSKAEAERLLEHFSPKQQVKMMSSKQPGLLNKYLLTIITNRLDGIGGRFRAALTTKCCLFLQFSNKGSER